MNGGRWAVRLIPLLVLALYVAWMWFGAIPMQRAYTQWLLSSGQEADVCSPAKATP